MSPSANLNLGLDLALDSSGDLAMSPQNDLATTPNGRSTLMQDVSDCLVLVPGDLYAHENSGTGIKRLLGEDDVGDLLVSLVTNALIYDEMTSQRIDPNTVVVTRMSKLEAPGQAILRIEFSAITDGTTNNFNVLYNAQSGEIENLA